MTTVVVADDQGMVRSGLISLLEGDPDVTVVGEAADGAQAVAVVARTDPDVVLMDIRMPELDGLSATRQLVADQVRTRVLVLTTFDLDEYVFEALRSGASGFLLKDAPAEELLNAVRLISRGDAVLSPAVTRRVIEEFAASRPSSHTEPSPALTPRELEILRYLGRGLSNAEIAADLVLSESTVKTHVSRVLLKLGLRDRVQAVIYAYECGLQG
ncbi:MAG TPA: response regulator transcription factor [Actinomycetales bacterium]|nr:response regulator transcription factor [Actinomycetales bacterium]